MISKHILVLEDDSGTATTLYEVITSLGYQVTVCHNVETALSVLGAQSKYLAVLIDYKIEGSQIDGSHFAHEVAKNYPQIIRIFHSNMFDDQKASKDMEYARADGYIPKKSLTTPENRDQFSRLFTILVNNPVNDHFGSDHIRIDKLICDANGKSTSTQSILIRTSSIKFFQSNFSHGGNSTIIGLLCKEINQETDEIVEKIRKIEHKINIGAFEEHLREKLGHPFPFNKYDRSLFVRNDFDIGEITDDYMLNIYGVRYKSSAKVVKRFLKPFQKIYSRISKS